MVGVFLAKKASGVAVAVTGAGENGVFRCSEIEKVLNSSFNLESLDNVEISPDGLNSDIHASASYRANLIKEMAKRALKEII
jgi:carbon-monoxide dehydrogenase medium subunit